MSFASTTLAAACSATDTSITVASATSVAAGRFIYLDNEIMKVSKGYVNGAVSVPVLRGQDGTAPALHANTSPLVHGEGADFASNTPQQDTLKPMVQTRVINSYNASGAIAFGAASVTFAYLLGTSALAMTLALPTLENNGQIIHVIGQAKSASTVATTTAGFGNAGASYDTFTLQNAGNCTLSFIAANGFWSILNTPITGTSTALSAAIA